MGLDISLMVFKDSFRAGSYSGFGDFRTKLAEMGDVLLEVMVGFGGDIPWTEDEAFYELLNHSDCDGELHPYECKELIKDFEKYQEEWLLKVEEEGLSPYYIGKYETWLEFLRQCVAESGVLHFG